MLAAMMAGWLAGAVTVDGSVENFKRQRQTEIKHGRPCMLAAIGCITPEIIGKLPGAVADALVVGWLAGAVTADGSVETFKRKRQTEIKHGHSCMLATMGCITPEIPGKLP
eukprot:8592168-Prorocentrum_lima.AAC.1